MKAPSHCPASLSILPVYTLPKLCVSNAYPSTFGDNKYFPPIYYRSYTLGKTSEFAREFAIELRANIRAIISISWGMTRTLHHLLIDGSIAGSWGMGPILTHWMARNRHRMGQENGF